MKRIALALVVLAACGRIEKPVISTQLTEYKPVVEMARSALEEAAACEWFSRGQGWPITVAEDDSMWSQEKALGVTYASSVEGEPQAKIFLMPVGGIGDRPIRNGDKSVKSLPVAVAAEILIHEIGHAHGLSHQPLGIMSTNAQYMGVEEAARQLVLILEPCGPRE